MLSQALYHDIDPNDIEQTATERACTDRAVRTHRACMMDTVASVMQRSLLIATLCCEQSCLASIPCVCKYVVSDCITDSLTDALTYLAKVAADPLTPL